MIYLIGGAPRCGKTTFAKMFAREKRIPGISTDLIASIVKPYIANAQGEHAFIAGNVCSEGPEEQLKGEIQNSHVLWPGIRRFMCSLLRWNHDYVIEGVHLLPALIHEFEMSPDRERLGGEFCIIYLLKKDTKKILEGLKKADPELDWLLQCVKTEDDLISAAESIRRKAIYFEDEAKKYGYRVINTEEDFGTILQNLLNEF